MVGTMHIIVIVAPCVVFVSVFNRENCQTNVEVFQDREKVVKQVLIEVMVMD